MFQRFILLAIIVACLPVALHAQDPQPAKGKPRLFRDTLDHKLDFSKYLIDMHGFVPYPTIITEPALGNFGGALALVFISPKKSAKKEQKYVFPDITAVAGMYTLNNTWGVGALHQGSAPSIGLRYRAGFGYASINVDFYREILGENRSFLINLKPVFALADLSENIWKNKIFGGISYQFSSTRMKFKLPEEHDTLRAIFDTLFHPEAKKENIGTLGFYAEWDNRNSMFTPDKGIRFRATYGLSRTWTGSTSTFDQAEVYTNVFFRPFKWWVCGFKAEWDWADEGAPFYLLPYLNMRGIPAIQYQGNQALSFETEQRFDLNLRWSLVGFVGTGRTFSNSKYLKDDTWYWAGGAGFRYLLARAFRLRMGIDIARGPDQFAYYIVFGHYWDR